ncbi:MAG: hypothetical protein U1F16_07930 [Turneriella sp.]
MKQWLNPGGRIIAGVALLSLSPMRMLTSSAAELPAGVRDFKAGKYTLSIQLEKPNRAKDGIEAELFIPPGVSGPTPAIVFVHGNSRDKKYYRRAANFMLPVAPAKKVMVLSVQNWWPLSGDHLDATEDTRIAINTLVNRLAAAGVFQPNQVYLSGFSAGGFIAMVTLLKSVDFYKDEGFRQKFATARAAEIETAKKSAEDYYYTVENPGREAGFFSYAGVISFKGNFYTKYFAEDTLLNDDERKQYTQKLMAGTRVVLTVGGDQEAKDVKVEVPLCRDFLKKSWGLKLDYHEYGDDVHDITKTDQDHLWAMATEPAVQPAAAAAVLPAVKETVRPAR